MIANKKKTQTTVDLNGYNHAGDPVGTHNAEEVRSFRNDKNSIVVKATPEGNVVVCTHDSATILKPHLVTKNLFTGVTEKGIKMHFTKKKIVAKVLYWS